MRSMTNKHTPTPASVSVNKAIELVLATADKTKKDLAALLDIAPSGVTRRFAKGSWTIDELELICRQVGAPMTALFDAESLSRFLAERAMHAADLGEPPTKWYTAELIGV